MFDILVEEVDNIIVKVIDMWLSVSGFIIKWEDNLDLNVDIRIYFVRGFYGDIRLVDGFGVELVYVFFFGVEDKDLVGDVYIDDDDMFVVNGGNGIDLLWLVVYELGYSFGFDYIYYLDFVMFVYYIGYRFDLKLDSDDI